MPLIISDETLRAANLTEQEARIEIACRLFDAERLNKPEAARLAGLPRNEFESELIKRGLAVIHIDEDYVRHDLEYARQFGADQEQAQRSAL